MAAAQLRVHFSDFAPSEEKRKIAMNQFDLRPPHEAQRALITSGLDANERLVLLEHGTEAAF
jgi:hypothetical protein